MTPTPPPQTVLAPVPIKRGVSIAVYERLAAKMYEKMPVPPEVTRVPYARLDSNAQNLWFLLARSAVEALNEMEV